MRIAAGLCLLLLLSGCDAIVQQDGDYFEASGSNPERYEMDAQACGTLAADYVSYDLRGMSGTSYDRNRAYNDVLARCMTGRGHPDRAYVENWLP